MRTLIILLIAGAALCGCAARPATPVPAAPASPASPPAASPATPAAALAAKARKSGFTPTTRGGQILYCRTDFQTGSHLNSETVCLTEKESREILEQSQRDLERNDLQLRMATPGGGK